MSLITKLRKGWEQVAGTGFDPERRRFGKLALGGAIGGAALLNRAAMASAVIHENPPGIKLSVQVGSDPTDEDLQFVRQLGAEYVNIWTNTGTANLDNFLRLKRNV